MQALLIKIGLSVVAFLAIAGSFYFMKLKLDTATSDAAKWKESAGYYKDALTAYRDTFAGQMESLNAEKRAEIKRQENLLTTLNLIGEIPENETITESEKSILDSLYGLNAAAVQPEP